MSVDLYPLCGGHGATFHATTVDSPDLNPRQRARIARGQDALVFTPCTLCDGRDRVTHLIEQQAEATS